FSLDALTFFLCFFGFLPAYARASVDRRDKFFGRIFLANEGLCMSLSSPMYKFMREELLASLWSGGLRKFTPLEK
ncbi:MAG: hypothetical protein JW740_00615, partial [Candidatus Zambryskibacteria bacterium]|nr:hypothetical protein [Candidatus Zambryskibacteria bacterium]